MDESKHIAAIRRDAAAYRRIIERRKANIVAAVRDGVMMRVIGEAAGIEGAYVRKIARDAGLEPRAPGRRKERG